MQEIERDSLSADGQSAYWYFRYTLRRRLSTSGQALTDERGNPHHDIPAFLEPHKALILNTGEPLLWVLGPLQGAVADTWHVFPYALRKKSSPTQDGCMKYVLQSSQADLADHGHASSLPGYQESP